MCQLRLIQMVRTEVALLRQLESLWKQASTCPVIDLYLPCFHLVN